MTSGTRCRTSRGGRAAHAWLAAVLVTVLAAVAGCSSNGAASGVVRVTVTSTVPSTPPNPPVATAAASATDPDSPAVSSSPGSGPASSRAATSTSEPTTTTLRPSTPTSTTSRPRTSTPTSNASTRPPASPSTGDLLKDAITLAAAAGVKPADPDTPGPETGPPCPADHNYVNEAPTGLRSDVITAWKAVVKTGKTKGITVCLNDGKRSRAQQLAQYNDYVEQYGKEVADQLVLPPNKSAHVIGIAVDVQPAKAYQWLQSTKGALGFCRIYDNEAWHFEYNPAYKTDGCPKRLPQPER